MEKLLTRWTMTQDEKIRYGATFVFATLGLKTGPLEMIGGFGGV
jgi:hypothetical protein